MLRLSSLATNVVFETSMKTLHFFKLRAATPKKLRGFMLARNAPLSTR